MTMPSLNDVSKKLYERLAASAPLAAKVSTRIYNDIPPVAAMPYVRFWFPSAGDWSTKTEYGQDLEIQLDVWTEKGGDKLGFEIVDIIRDALHNSPLSLGGGQDVTLRQLSVFTNLDEDGMARHYIARYNALVTES